MKVILQESVQKLGKVGDVVETAPGHFRNYLAPRGLAVEATPGALKKREEDLETLRKKAEAAHAEALQLAEKITGFASIKIVSKAGEGGKLYGKVTNKEIAENLSKLLEKEIDKRLITANEEMNALGSYKVAVKISHEVSADLIVEIQTEA